MDSADKKRKILSDLIYVTSEITNKFSSSQNLMTENNPDVEKLLHLLEQVLSFGLKNSIFENLFSSSSSSNCLWNFIKNEMPKSEQLRFSNFKNIYTDRGKIKALIRNGLNERTLQFYFLTWLSSENLSDIYEHFAILRDEGAKTILPKIAKDLEEVFFAITVDIPELNVSVSSNPIAKAEPIISVPSTSNITISQSTMKHHRKVCQFEETVSHHSSPKMVSGSLPSKSPPYESQYEDVPNFNDKISLISLNESSPSYLMKDDETISTSSSEEDFPSYTAAEANISSQNEKELIIQQQRERIAELELQNNNLILENNRLKNLLSASKLNSFANLHLEIKRAVLQKTTTKNFYLYEISLRSKDGEECWTIFKRYRDFYQFHKKLQKQYFFISYLDFPKKKKFGNLEFDFVEERRQRLQVYLRHVLQSVPEFANCSSRQILETKCWFFRN